jgi:hypothetical protein
MSTLLRRDIPIFLVTAIATVVLVDQFVNLEPLSALVSVIMNFGVISIGILYAVGSINLLIYLSKQWQRYEVNELNKYLYTYAIAFMLFYFLTSIFAEDWFSWIAANVRPGLAMSAITGCAIVLASYRSFRLRSLEAAALLITGMLTMFRLAPIGEVISPVIPQIGAWLLNPFARASHRGMQIGLGIGGVYTAIRTYLGRERRALGL